MSGDQGEGFEGFVLARSAALLRFAYLLTGDAGLAEDLVQEALIKVHRQWARISVLEGPEAYVRRIVSNEFVSWRRRRRSRETPSEVPERADPSDRSAGFVEREALWSALQVLPPRQRAVVVLRYYEDLSDAEIAGVLRCAVGTVRSLQSRALTTLRARADVHDWTVTRRGEA